MAARGRGEGSVYCDSTGQWKAALDLGEVGGRRVRVRRNARNKTHAAKLLRELRFGYDTTSPRSVPTVAAWMQQWLAICDTKLRHQTMIGYHQYVRLYIEPELGHLRLDRLTIERSEALYGHMRSAGSRRAPSTPVTASSYRPRPGRQARDHPTQPCGAGRAGASCPSRLRAALR